jgi:hypothetical protein
MGAKKGKRGKGGSGSTRTPRDFGAGIFPFASETAVELMVAVGVRAGVSGQGSVASVPSRRSPGFPPAGSFGCSFSFTGEAHDEKAAVVEHNLAERNEYDNRPWMRGCPERFQALRIALGTTERPPRNGQSSAQFERGFAERVDMAAVGSQHEDDYNSERPFEFGHEEPDS